MLSVQQKCIRHLSEKKDKMPVLWQQIIIQAKDCYNNCKGKMIYDLKLYVKLPKKELSCLYASIKEEFKENRLKRSNIALKLKDKKLLFLITANDATALSASVNAVIKLLTVYEKTSQVVAND